MGWSKIAHFMVNKKESKKDRETETETDRQKGAQGKV
jgi:hypothetical protein